MMKNKKIDENISIDEIDKKLIELKSNLNQIEILIDREKQTNPTKLNEIIKIQKEIKLMIQYYDDFKKFKIQTSPLIYNNTPFNNSDIGRICSAYFEEEKKWFTAIINEVFSDQTVEITWLGYKNKEILNYKYIKMNELLKSEELEVGNLCEAIYYEDGKWYNATIEMISEHGVHVKFNKYENVEVVSFDSIRYTPDNKQFNIKRKESNVKQNNSEDILEFKIPDHLKINPSDNDTQRLSKRKRVKAMKNKHKQEILEKISKEKQEDWLSFAQKAPKIHKYGSLYKK